MSGDDATLRISRGFWAHHCCCWNLLGCDRHGLDAWLGLSRPIDQSEMIWHPMCCFFGDQRICLYSYVFLQPPMCGMCMFSD